MKTMLDGISYDVRVPIRWRIPWRTVIVITLLALLFALGSAHAGSILPPPQSDGGGGAGMLPI